MDQDVCLFSRKRMELGGIEEVESFSETEIVLVSSLGRIAVNGSGLKIGRFSAEQGTLELTGTVDAFVYLEGLDGDGGEREKRGFFGRLFR